MTYSLAATGARADYLPNQPAKTLSLSDTSSNGDVVGYTAVQPTGLTAAGLARSMQLGTWILCKNPDLSQSWYVVDGYSSLNGQPLLRPVGP